jgi:CheY-like chemotaxis protein
MAIPEMRVGDDLEEQWRLQVERAFERYRRATTEYRKLLSVEREGWAPEPDGALAQAREAETHALLEYSTMLRRDVPTWGRIAEGINMITVIDDDESVRDATKTLLRSAGYKVSTFESAETFLESGALADTGCLILDVRMPGMDGLTLQRRLSAQKASVPIIFVTAHDDARSRQQAIEGGAMDFLCKPFEANTLVSAVETALVRRSVHSQDAG